MPALTDLFRKEIPFGFEFNGIGPAGDGHKMWFLILTVLNLGTSHRRFGKERHPSPLLTNSSPTEMIDGLIRLIATPRYLMIANDLEIPT